MSVLEQFTCVFVRINFWEGRKKLTAEDIDIPADKVPPEEVASLGSMRLFPREPLREFHAIRKSVERTCLSHGSRFMGGYLVPDKNKASLADKLAALQTRYESAVARLVAGYDEKVGEFKAKYPAFAEQISKAQISKLELGGRCTFRFTMFDVGVASGVNDKANLEHELQSVSGQVLLETSIVAAEIAADMDKRQSTTQKSVKTLKAIQSKLLDFALIDPKLGTISGRIEALIETLPKEGRLSDKPYEVLKKVFKTLADPDRAANLNCYPAPQPLLQPKPQQLQQTLGDLKQAAASTAATPRIRSGQRQLRSERKGSLFGKPVGALHAAR